MLGFLRPAAGGSLRALTVAFGQYAQRSSGGLLSREAWHEPLCAASSKLMSTLPPHMELTMPALSPTMEQGNIASWQVKEGDEVTAGDVLCEVETDKATMAWENQDDGFVAKLLKGSGSKDIPVGTPVLILVEDEGNIAAFKDYQADSSSAPAQQSEEAAAGSSQEPSSGDSQQQHDQRAGGQKASGVMGPAARMLLQKAGLSADDVWPTGPRGIITKGDVLAAIEGSTQPGQSPSQKQASPPPKAGKDTAAEQQPQKDTQTDAGQREPAKPKQPKQQQQQQQQQQQPAQQQQQQRPRQPPVPDSYIRALLANQMLEKGEQIPANWLRDWVGITEAKQQAPQQQ